MRIELVAAEPLVADPVAFDWGPDGRLWVAEMGDYPNGATWNKAGDPVGEAGGRVKLLTDTDGDGRYDHASLFLDKVPFPTGVKSWRKGVLVGAAPEVFYAEDTDGDGRADRRETLFEGFSEGNQQHRVNGLRWGLDNWLYLANGDSGGSIKSRRTGATVELRGRDLRIRPDTGELEAVSGQTQFGRDRDDWGNWFGGNNSNPMWHYVLDDTYLRRNPHFAPPSVRHAISDQPGAAPVFPTSRTLTRFNDFDKVDRFTSACSPMVDRDELLFGPSEKAEGVGQAFICEPVHNLVHREIVAADGATFRSRRADDERDTEFLSSSDNWFRPVMARTGPDGALWIADMYRLVIEHPEWIPTTWQQKLDLRAGHDRGRIYRVLPTDAAARQIPRLDQLATAALVHALDSPNGWQRDMVQQMLLWRQDDSATQPLRQLALHAQRPTTRVQALCTLDGLSALDGDLLATALDDRHPGVRRHAVRLSEPWLNDSPQLVQRLASLLEDEDAQVRMQLAYSLGSWNNPQAGRDLAKLALAAPADGYLRAAVMSSVTADNAEQALSVALREAASQPELLSELLKFAASRDDRRLLRATAAKLLQPSEGRFSPWQFDVGINLLRALGRRRDTLPELLGPEAAGQVQQLAAVALQIAQNLQQTETARLQGIELFGLAASPEDLRTLTSLFEARQPAAIQVAAVDALASRGHPQAPQLLLANWPARAPALRARILDALLARPTWTAALLSAMEDKVVSADEIDARLRQQLLQHRDAEIRERSARLLAASTNGDRERVLAEYRRHGTLPGDVPRGREVFQKSCSACHRLDGIGKQVGPDLISLTDKSPEALLVALLDPNRAVEDKFRSYVALTVDGRQLAGMIAGETATSVTLAAADGKEHVLLRTELDELRSTGKSLMPDGLEKDLSPQAVADVIAFVRSVAAPPKQFPGNTPQVVPVRDDGSIRLFAMFARVYGPTLVFEEKYRNLGYWGSLEDHAIWSLEVPRAGKYYVTMEYACEDRCAGNRFVATVAGHTLTGVVEGSGSWDHYRTKSLGTVELATGPCEFLLRSDGKIRSYLMDLSMIRLQPAD